MKPEVKKVAFVLVLCCGIALRIWLSTLGWNYDVLCWVIYGAMVEEGQNLYVDTSIGYNYGPIWAGIAWLILRFRQALGFTGMTSFHVLVAGFLSIVDVGIAMTLARAWGYIPAVLFFLCPVSILITGFHSQIDNIAILLALWSWRALDAQPEGSAQPDDVIWPGVLLGLSLATKHVFAFFPLWVLALRSRPVRQRLAYAGIAYAVFLGSFIPYILTSEGFAGAKNTVFLYRGEIHFGNALLPRLIPDQALWAGAFEAGMLAVGFIIARWAPREVFFLYPVALVTFATTMADQYLAIPLISFAAYWKHLPMWAYILAATTALLGSKNNVGSLGAMQFIAAPLRATGFTLSPDAHSTLFPQIFLLVFLLSWPIAASIRHRVTRPSSSADGPEVI